MRKSPKEKSFNLLKKELMLRVEEFQGMFFLITGLGGYTKITEEQYNNFVQALYGE